MDVRAHLAPDPSPGEAALYTINEWRAMRAGQLRAQLHELCDLMRAAGELVADGTAGAPADGLRHD